MHDDEHIRPGLGGGWGAATCMHQLYIRIYYQLYCGPEEEAARGVSIKY